MVHLYGRLYGEKDLLKRIGGMDQVGGVKLLELSDGAERGVRVALIRSGELNFLVAVDRCMDIVNAEYKGIPLGWISPTGIVSPGFYEPEGLGWTRGFSGGLLTTCGLTYMGAPTVDQGEPLGLHGRISYIPARLIYAGSHWEGDEYVTALEGEAKEAKVFEPNIALRRRIEARLGKNHLVIHDKVTNEGWEIQPLMILYHVNIGFPVMDDGSNLISTSRLYVPRDEEAKGDAERFDQFHQPTSGYKEKVYFHDMLTDAEGYAHSAIVNEKLLDGIAVYVKYRRSELPRFIEWKMMGEGTYVVGMEPANGLVVGRDKERKWGTLQYLKPQETREFHIEIGVLVGEEVQNFKEKISSITKGAKSKMIGTVEEFVEVTRSRV
nr:aldose 1-epimerase family protein [Candidatus Njordarchaeum guaymaensis]